MKKPIADSTEVVARRNFGLNFAIAYFEERVGNVRTGQWARFAQTGDEYQTYSAQHEFAEIAIEGWLALVLPLAVKHRGTLYWRVVPRLEENKNGWHVYSRFVISDKPADKWLTV